MATRHEKVIVDLEDRVTRPLAGMAASVALFRRNIEGSDRDLIKFDRTTTDVGRNIDKLSGRLGLLTDLAVTLGPALIPTMTAAVPLAAGLANQFGFAAIAGGTAILAFNGVGDALKAVNEQALHPSEANLKKMHDAMAQLGPAGRDFVRELQSMRPEMQKLQNIAQAGMFPGLTEGLQALGTRMPEVESIISEVSDTVGGLLADAGKSLASPEWNQFFHMLETEARPSLQALGESIGQVTKGLADLWVAFTPLNRSFSQGMLEASRSFADWAHGLSQTQGFADFLDYLHTTGPQVAAALGAIGHAVMQVLQAAAPLGGPALKAITAFSNAIAAIADSSLGTPIMAAVAAWRAYSMAVGLAEKAQMRFNASSAAGGIAGSKGGKGGLFSGYTASLLGVTSAQERAQTAAGKTSATVSAQRVAFAKAAAGAALLGVATTGVADSMGLSNTAMLGLTGFLVGGGIGAAMGTAAGAAIDLAHANDGLNDSLDKLAAMAGKVDFSTFNAQLAEAQKHIDDLRHVTGIGDALSDTAKGFGYALTHPGKGHLDQVAEAQGNANASQLRQQMGGRNAGALAASQQYLAASRLAQQGFQLTAAGARDAAMSVQQFAASMQAATRASTQLGNLDAATQAIFNFRDSLKENGKTLDATTRKGLANRASLRAVADAYRTAGVGIQDVAKKTKYLDSARKTFVGLARDAGMTRVAARRLADTLGLVDRIHATPKVEEQGAKPSQTRVQQLRAEIAKLKDKTQHTRVDGADAAKAKIGQLRAAIAALRDKTVTVHYNVVRSGSASAGQTHAAHEDHGARGMLWYGGDRHYAYGDIANGHQPELAGPGPTRVWREPETMGEAYIPLANDSRRPRARAIAAETVSLLGGTAYFANGGLSFARGGINDGRHDREIARAHKEHASAVKASTKAINREKAAREKLVGKRNDLSGSVRDSFLSDPFSTDNVWAAGAGDPRSILKADIAKANAFKHQLAVLKHKGLNGDALAAVAATGDVGKAAALASMSAPQVRSYGSLYKQRAAAAAAVGKYAGNAAYGPQIAAINHKLSQLVHATHQGNHDRRNTGRDVGREINRSAAHAGRNRR